MRRISSLPVSEYCGKADEIGKDVETTNAKRSTIFHAYCESGEWPEAIKELPKEDVEEINKWKVPRPLVITVEGKEIRLSYKNAIKEIRVAVDKDFNYIEVPHDLPLSEVQGKFPSILCIGHLDMAWHVPEHDLVVINDIKSSIFAVKARCKSLQLHGYGIAFAQMHKAKKYLTAIWDACDGKHYVDDKIVELDSFECEEYKERIRAASTTKTDSFVVGSHCGGCWKRQSCPAHMVDVPKDHKYYKLLSGDATEADVRQGLIDARQLADTADKLKRAAQDWVKQHGPIRSEDGTKEWTVAMRNGRKSLDKSLIEKEFGNLDRFMSEGNPFEVFDWRNVRE